VRRADRILVVERGRIAESGSHAELMQQGGIYHRLYSMQFTDSVSGERLVVVDEVLDVPAEAPATGV
jgi:hypothetical protein